MAKQIFNPPSTKGYRSVTDTSGMNGNINNAARMPEMGGFTSSRKFGAKSPFGPKPPKQKG